MAWTSASVWEVRPDGSNANGIGFDPALGGTDYSQQAAAQAAATDGVTNGTTTVTSATLGFTAAMVGNGLNISGDNLYQIKVVVSATQVTVDRATANGGAGRSMKVGGAGAMDGGTQSCLRPYEFGVIQPGNGLYIRATNAAGVATTYAPTTKFTTIQANTSSVNGAEFNYIKVEGYSTVRGDGGVPVVTAAAGINWTGNYTVLKNVRFNGTSTSGSNFLVGQTGTGTIIENCIFDNHLAPAGFYGTEGGAILLYRNCWFIAQPSPTAAFRDTGGTSRFEFCRFDGGAGGVNYDIEANVPRFWGCIFNGGTSVIQINQNSAAFWAQFCIIWNGSSFGIDIPSGIFHDDQNLLVTNCIIGKNGTTDIRHQNDETANNGAQWWVNEVFRCNWFFTTGTNRYTGLPAASDDQALTANPFNNDAAGDFSLNGVTGGGALITANPCKYAFPDGLNTATALGGYYGTQPATSSTATMRNLWRELTNERNTQVIPDSVVDIYLDWGLQELNRRIRYHYTTAADITLVAGVQEYAVPAAAIEIVFVQYDSNRLLDKGDVEQWRRLGEDWRNEPQGEPRFWAHYGGNSFVIRPAPSALAVAKAPNLTVRRKDVPPSITTNGPEQLPQSYFRLVVLYGAALWSAAYPDSAVAQQRAAYLKQEFETGVTAAIEEMARRSVSL